MKKLLLLLVISFSSIVNAQVLHNIIAETSDVTIDNSNKRQWVGYHTHQLGTNKIVSAIIPFQLPTLGVNEKITAAEFSTQLTGITASLDNEIDIYALPYRSSNAILDADYFAGTTDASNQLIEKSFFTKLSTVAKHTTNVSANVVLIDFINQQYTNGAVGGDFIFIRLNLNTDNTSNYNYWNIASQDNGTEGFRPLLTLTSEVVITNNPTFNSPLSNQIVNEGSTKVLDVSATDPNGDNLTFSPVNLPTFAVLSQNVNGTASITVSPKVGDVGTYSNVSITVSDGTYSDVQIFDITVKDPNVNAAPVIDPIANQAVEENQTKTINISVVDADGNSLTLDVLNKPTFASFTDNGDGTATLNLAPSNSDIGNYIDVEITAFDGKVTVSEKFNIEVTEKQIIVGTSYYCDPVNGNMNNDGLSEATAWGSLQDAIGAKKRFLPGDVIFLMNGSHGQPYLSGGNNGSGSSDGYITIRPVQGQKPVIASVQLENGNYWSFDGVTFSSDGSGGNFSRDYMITTNNTFTNLKIINCTFHSGEDSSSWTKADWYSNSEDAVMVRGDYLIFNNNIITNTYFAFQMEGDYAEVKNNLIDNFGADAIRALGSHALYEGNLIRDAYVEDYGINHDDAIQMYQRSNVTSGVVSDVIIRGNKIYNFADPITQAMKDDKLVGYSMQGIIQTDGHSDNIIVENNLVVSDHYHGITLPGAVNCRVQNNTVMKTPTSVNPTTDAHPWIRFAKDKQGNFAHDCVMRNNISTFKTEGIYWEFDENPTSGYDRNNLRENNIEQVEANYSNLFVNYSGFDFHLVDGSAAIDAGVNTSLTSTDIDGNIRMVGSTVDIGCYEVQAANDETLPTLTNAQDTYFDNEVVVTFSESVTKITAEDISNYSLDNGATVLNAVLDVDAVTVTLTTSILDGNILYTITANNIEDFAGNKASNTSTTFTYLCGTISASSYQDDQWGVNPPAGAFDGDMNTKWSAEGDGEWIMKNYCTTQLISSVSIAFERGDTRIYDFSVETSLDGINFTEAYSGSSSNTLDIQTFTFSGVTGKYLRIVGGGSDTNLWNNYVEISIESVEAPNDPTLVEDDFVSISFVVYPNPVVSNNFNVKLPKEINSEDVIIRLFQVNGVEVAKTISRTESDINVSLPLKTTSGVYFLLISNNELTIQKKIVIK